MGNIFEKPRNIKNKDLYKSLIETNLTERLLYIENKIDNLDAKVWSLEANTQANLKVMSADIHTLHEKINY